MVLIGSDILVEMEHEILVIKRNVKVAHDRKKSYVDQHGEFKEF